MSPRPHLVLFDALNVLRRLHAANAGAVMDGARQAVQRCLKGLQASHGLAVFDGQQPSWRYRLYPAYKEGRPPMPADLAERLPAIQDAWLEQGIDSLLPAQDEADDVLASLAIAARCHGVNVTIISTDKGFGQLLPAGVAQFDAFGRRYLDGQHWQHKLGVSPVQLVDYWALVGDSTNKVPGVPGIGPKGATQLLAAHGSLDAMLASDPADKALQKVKDHSDAAELARTLLSLKVDLKLDLQLNQMRIKERAS
ncbi:flap endonuclease Xni [Gallaecimonas sp. GXIMD4217]|uniref:flap endonuclease Xni n=1 Tax=Gallaecimonas sp. GXIMD4217 TaxID=3131927 RepID=UPI00311AF976